MWSLFRSATPVASRTRARLTLESLDGRCAPSSLLDPTAPSPTDTQLILAPADATSPDATSSTKTTTSTNGAIASPMGGGGRVNQAPTIINFTGAQDTGNIWILSGDVLDEAPAGLTITFGGAQTSLQGRTVTTDANGHFALVISLNTDGTDDGTATAQTVDNQGLASNLAQDYIRPSG